MKHTTSNMKHQRTIAREIKCIYVSIKDNVHYQEHHISHLWHGTVIFLTTLREEMWLCRKACGSRFLCCEPYRYSCLAHSWDQNSERKHKSISWHICIYIYTYVYTYIVFRNPRKYMYIYIIFINIYDLCEQKTWSHPYRCYMMLPTPSPTCVTTDSLGLGDGRIDRPCLRRQAMTRSSKRIQFLKLTSTT